MKFLFWLPVAAAARSVSTAADLDMMKSTLVSLAEKKKAGEPISAATKDIIARMLQNIKDTLDAALEADRKAAQATMDAALKAVNDCKDNRDTEFAAEVATAISDRQTAEADFHSCKDGNPALLQKSSKKASDPTDPNHGNIVVDTHDYGFDRTRTWHSNATLGHTAHEKEGKEDVANLCGKLNTTVRSFGNAGVVMEIDNADYCSPAKTGECTDAFRFTLQLESSETWFRHMDAFESTNAQKYKDERDACHQARQQHIIRVAECSRLQAIFESKACAEANLIDERCHYYDGCYTTETGNWETTKKEVECLEEQFKAQQHALEILQCYGAEIQADSTDLSRCNDETIACADCAKLTIDYTVPHPQIPCTEDLDTYRPCHLSWFNANYGEYLGSACPVNDCQACADPSLPTYS